MQKLKHITILLSLVALIGACAPIQANRGNLLTDAKLTQIQTDFSTRNEVRKILGTPTIVAPFDSSIWYYVGQRTETTGAFETEVVEERTIRIAFNEDGVLQSVEDITDATREDISLVERQTPTAGKEFTFIQQMIGNVGRFEATKNVKKKPPSGGGTNN